MRWRALMARTLEKLAGDVLTSELMGEILHLRDGALAAAQLAAPYLHARLAPMVPKGEKGMTVQLIIEDA